ncbi:MAG: hypothetical protein WCL11_06175 [Verrucomicrobiota bacterium]
MFIFIGFVSPEITTKRHGVARACYPPGGDSNPNALYCEKADCALRSRNFGKALVRLKPIDFKISDAAPFVGVPLANPPSRLLLYEPFDYLGRARLGDLNTTGGRVMRTETGGGEEAWDAPETRQEPATGP